MMCMICNGLARHKLSAALAREKLEEFVDLDLLDEDHQESVETLISEAEEEELYWSAAFRDTRKLETFDDDGGLFEEMLEDVDSFDDPDEEL